jgi:hypothetical protein
MMIYVGVTDVAEALKKAEALGGTTIVPPIPIPTGTFAWFADPEAVKSASSSRRPERVRSAPSRLGAHQSDATALPGCVVEADV